MEEKEPNVIFNVVKYHNRQPSKVVIHGDVVGFATLIHEDELYYSFAFMYQKERTYEVISDNNKAITTLDELKQLIIKEYKNT